MVSSCGKSSLLILFLCPSFSSNGYYHRQVVYQLYDCSSFAQIYFVGNLCGKQAAIKAYCACKRRPEEKCACRKNKM